MSSSRSIEVVETDEENEDYTEDFDEASACQVSSSHGCLAYSDEFEATNASPSYSDKLDGDFASARSLIFGLYNTDSENKTLQPKPHPRKSIDTPLVCNYPKDTEPSALVWPQAASHSGRAETVTTLDIQNCGGMPRLECSVDCTDEFVQYSRTPRRDVRARTLQRMKSLEIINGCSGDLDSSIYTPRTPRQHSSIAKSDIHNLTYSTDFKTEMHAPGNATPLAPKSPRTPRRSGHATAWSAASTLAYSDEFESVTTYTPRTPRVGVNGTAYPRVGNLTYSDDFEPTTKTPRSVAQSNDFESTTARIPKQDPRYSTDTLYSYTQSFDSDEDISSEAHTVGSTTETTESDRLQVDSSSEAVMVTGRTVSESDPSTYSNPTTSEMTEMQHTGMHAEAAERQFIMRKLSVLLNTDQSKHRKITPPSLNDLCDGTTTMFLRKKLGLLMKKHNEHTLDKPRGLSTIEEPPRRHLVEKDKNSVADLGISMSVINRLKTENSLGRMKKFVVEKIHEPNECPACRDQLMAVALREFAHKKKILVEAKLIEDQIEKNQYLYGDVVALMGEGLRALPSHSANRKDVMEQLLQPWSTEIWGSNVLKDDQKRVENERRDQKPPKPNLTCPHLARFEDDDGLVRKNSNTRAPLESCRSLFKDYDVGLFKDNNVSEGVGDEDVGQYKGRDPMFSDGTDASQLRDTRSGYEVNPFNVYAAKYEQAQRCSDRGAVDSTRRPDRGSFPVGEHWEDIRTRLDSTHSDTPRATIDSRIPFAAMDWEVPIGLEVPGDREEFWKQYFAPLKNCSCSRMVEKPSTDLTPGDL